MSKHFSPVFGSWLRTWHNHATAICSLDSTFANESWYQKVEEGKDLIINYGDDLINNAGFGAEVLDTWNALKEDIQEVSEICDLHKLGIPAGTSATCLLQKVRYEICEVMSALKERFLNE